MEKNNRDIEFLFYLLFQAFVEIREESATNKNYNKSFILSDIFHNLPLRLSKVHNLEMKDTELIAQFIELMTSSKYKKWITDNGQEFKDTEIMKRLNSPMRIAKK